jgi:BCD family chlorophyll transporter-like MFS transporter
LTSFNQTFARGWRMLGTRFLPFADAATEDLPLGRLIRLSLFQVSVGMAMVLFTGTLNRVMIVELHVPAWLVGLMVSLPLVFAPFRALIGFKSDTHRSVLGWRRVPYLWFGTLLQFGGFAILPFALLVLTGEGHGPVIYGQLGAALAFLLVGAGLHTTQTAGLALANDLAPAHARPRVVALLYVMLLVGMTVSALAFGALLRDFTSVQLIQIIQAAAVITFVLNGVALWKQEPRNPKLTDPSLPRISFQGAMKQFANAGRSRRLLVAVGLGTAGFSMQDILLEPYGGQVFGLSVGSTTVLTALLAAGTLAGFTLAARLLGQGVNPHRVAALGILAGVTAFAAVIFAAPLDAANLFRLGTAFIGVGSGLFAVGMLVAAMQLAESNLSGLALGAWGAVQATAAGLAIMASGFIRDGVSYLGASGILGEAMSGPEAGYGVVYHIEILLLFATLVALGPLVRNAGVSVLPGGRFGLAELPG